MALKIYEWHGYTYQIADEDLKFYPGAKLKEPVKDKKDKAPANKTRQTKNK